MKLLKNILISFFIGGFAACHGLLVFLILGVMILSPILLIIIVLYYVLVCAFGISTNYVNSIEFSNLLTKIFAIICCLISISAFINSFYVNLSGNDNWFNAMCFTQDKKEKNAKSH